MLGNFIVPSLGILQFIIQVILTKYVIIEIMKNTDSFGKFTLCIFQLFTIILGYTYYLLAAYMDPGYVTKEMVEKMKNDPEYREELDEFGSKCICGFCKMQRPLRSHHCYRCGKCVLVYDHHCYIINNCVGHRNYKVFISFLFIWFWNAVFSLILIGYRFSNFQNSLTMKILLIGSIIFYLVIGSQIVMQLIVQIPLLITNTTFVEMKENRRFQQIYSNHKITAYNRYHTGNIAGNIACRFGSNPLFWFLPTPNYDKGYIFEQNPLYVPVYKIAYHDNENFYLDEDRPHKRQLQAQDDTQ